MQPPSELEIARTLPPAGCSLAEAGRYTRWLATHHYENFHVATWLLPRQLRQHFYNVYAYCRWADDLGDEVATPSRALELLDWWDHELSLCYAGNATHPVFIALAPTIHAFDIPVEPFRHLLIAFRQDQTVHRYQSWDDLLGYCRYSAEPVGRLVLYLCGYRDAERQRLSDATCTGLQLANFWQDVSRDLTKGRLYIPVEDLERHGLTVADIESRRFDERYAALMKDLIARTRGLFAAGAALTSRVDATLRVDLELFTAGGLAILSAIEKRGCNTLEHRPALGAATKARLLAQAVSGSIRNTFRRRAFPHLSGGGGQPPAASHGPASDGSGEPDRIAPSRIVPGVEAPAGLSDAGRPAAVRPDAVRPDAVPNNAGGHSFQEASAIASSYAECRRVARLAASNFYYAFYLLPKRKRDALCALYAFMRLVDDVSDTPANAAHVPRGVADEEITAAEPPATIVAKRAVLARWRGMLDRAVAGEVTGHPILPAFADTVRRYRIPPRYFHDLISGAEMDLTETRYATFERLHEYCYRVAGTVGLTCLHVFGFDDPHAPELAVQLGVAFQLTNIIRDVGADLALGRVYLPSEDLTRFGCSVSDLASGAATPRVRALLRAEAERAWNFYAQGARLMHHIDRDSRAALWALTRIYSALLARIEERNFDVFSSRVRLNVSEKTRILVRARLGWWSEADVLEERDRDRRGTGGTFVGRRAG